MTTAAFRAFTDADFETHAGVETKDPRIAELPRGVVILDGERVDLVLADEQVTRFGMGYVRRGVARLVAEYLAAMQRPTHAEIEEYLERI